MFKKIKDKFKAKLKKWLECDCQKSKDVKVINMSIENKILSNYLSTSNSERYITDIIAKNKNYFKKQLGK